MEFMINDVKIEATGLDQYHPEELETYVQRGRQKYGSNLKGLKLKFDGEFVDIEYLIPPFGFNRLRRITGHLVGDVSRWNNGKRAELNDRVKHDTEA